MNTTAAPVTLIWIKGGELGNEKAVFGAKGVFNHSFVPSARSSHLMIASKHFAFIFGGEGIGTPSGSNGFLGDLWKVCFFSFFLPHLFFR